MKCVIVGKSNAGIIKEEVKGKISEVKEIKIHKCSRKSYVDIIIEEIKEEVAKKNILEYLRVGEEVEKVI